MKNFMQMLTQASQIQAKIQQIKDEMARLEFVGQSGGGLVTVTMSGEGIVRGVKIDKSLAKPEEIEILEDLIVAAAKEAKLKADTAMKEKMQAATAGLPLPPGLSKLF
jgi:DNA-binding YbaB/EbfC family protein